jgi:hypothetical protein
MCGYAAAYVHSFCVLYCVERHVDMLYCVERHVDMLYCVERHVDMLYCVERHVDIRMTVSVSQGLNNLFKR